MSLSIKQEKRLVGLICFILPFAIINSYMLNIALSPIAKEFGIYPSTASWIITISGILSALGALIYGKLADFYGVKKLVSFGLILFSVGSVWCFFAHNFTMLMIGRVIQGIGVSSIPSLAMLIPVRFIAAERRGKAMGTVASVMAFAGILGPALGGVVTGFFHWKYLFLITAMIGLVLPFVRQWIPDETKKERESIDYFGISLLMATILLLMQSITQWNGWFLISSLVLFLFFLLQQQRSQHPIVPFSLLQNAPYRQGMLMGAINTITNFGVFLLTPLLFSQVYGLKGDAIGFLLIPGAIAATLIGRYGGKLTDQKGKRFISTIAITILFVGFFMLSAMAGVTFWAVSFAIILTEVGYIFMQPALANWVSQNIPSQHSGMGMGIYGLVNFLVIAVGGSLLSKGLEWTSLPAWLPFAQTGLSTVYSNLYLGLFLLTVLNVFCLYQFMYKSKKGEEKAKAI